MSKRHRFAFTLVELLVVIGIIAVLISILLPTLSRARASANTVVCKSNLREIYNCVRMYANDYRDKFPDTYTVGGAFFRRSPGDVNPADPGSLPERYGMPAVLHGIPERGDIFEALAAKPRYLAARSPVWTCPAARDDIRTFGNTYMNYLLPALKPTDPGSWTSLQRGRQENADTFFLNDNFTNLPYVTGFRRNASDPNPTIPAAQRAYPHPYRTRSNRAVNMLYINGSVGTVVYYPNGKTEKIAG